MNKRQSSDAALRTTKTLQCNSKTSWKGIVRFKLSGDTLIKELKVPQQTNWDNRLFACHGHVTLSVIKDGRGTKQMPEMERACQKYEGGQVWGS